MNPTEPPSVFAPVLDRLRPDAVRLFGPGAALRPLSWQVRPFSYVLRLEFTAGDAAEPCAYGYAKVFKPKPGPDGIERVQRRVQHEFDSTQAVHESLAACPGLGVVRPLACYPDLLTIVTEECPGETLSAFIEREVSWLCGNGAVARASAVLSSVGRWVRAFQQTPLPDGGVVTPESIREYVDLRLQRLVAHGSSMVTPALRIALLRHLDVLGTYIPPKDWREVPIHADLAPGNVLVADGRIVVLDFAMMGRGTRLHDLTRLWMQLDLLSTKPRYRALVVGRLQSALLAGYGDDVTPELPLFRLLSVLHRVNHLGTLTLKPARFPARLLDLARLRRHERWLRSELEQWRVQ